MSDAKQRNIQIPLVLFKKIIELLEYWDVSGYDLTIQSEHHAVLCALRTKQSSLDLRKAYSQIIYAKDEDQRDEARMRYLRQKHYLRADSYRKL